MDKQQEQQKIREAIDRAWALTEDDLEWKPYYPNNMRCNGQEGWYCIVQEAGSDSATKYTILFQYHEDEEFNTHLDQDVELYVLCYKSYSDLDGPLAYPEPSEESDMWDSLDINDSGTFLHAYPTLEQAKARVLWGLRMHGYILSHLLEDEEDETQ